MNIRLALIDVDTGDVLLEVGHDDLKYQAGDIGPQQSIELGRSILDIVRRLLNLQ